MLAVYIILSADVAHLSVLIHKALVLLFAIHSAFIGLKSTHMQRGELHDKQVKSMEVLLERE